MLKIYISDDPGYCNIVTLYNTSTKFKFRKLQNCAKLKINKFVEKVGSPSVENASKGKLKL